MNFSEHNEATRGAMSRSLCGRGVSWQSEAAHQAAVNSIPWGEGRLQLPDPRLGPILGWLPSQMVLKRTGLRHGTWSSQCPELSGRAEGKGNSRWVLLDQGYWVFGIEGHGSRAHAPLWLGKGSNECPACVKATRLDAKLFYPASLLTGYQSQTFAVTCLALKLAFVISICHLPSMEEGRSQSLQGELP